MRDSSLHSPTNADTIKILESERVRRVVECAEEVEQLYWQDESDTLFNAFNKAILESIAANDLSPAVKLWKIFRLCNKENAMLINDLFYFLCGDGIDKLWEKTKLEATGDVLI